MPHIGYSSHHRGNFRDKINGLSRVGNKFDVKSRSIGFRHLLYQCLNLIKFKLNIGISAKHRNLCMNFFLVRLNFGNDTDKPFKRTLFDSDIIADRKVELYGLMFKTHILNLFGG